jgi:LuxR family transcriptional regulator, maltose regulon positive regulatory protein
LKNHIQFMEELTSTVNIKNIDEVALFLELNILNLFSSRHITTYFSAIRDLDIECAKSNLAKLIYGWLAFLSGDNASLEVAMRKISEDNLKDAYEKSFYYSLKSFTNSINYLDDGIEYSKLSLEMLQKDDRSFFMANSLLTYAQQLLRAGHYEIASGYFNSANLLFREMKMIFPSMVSLLNEMICRYLAGKFDEVIKTCKQELSAAMKYDGNEEDDVNLLHLPIGMCYYESNRLHLAVEHLKKAQATIEKMDLFHMYGLTELFLFKIFFVMKEESELKNLLDESIAKFGKLNYVSTDILISVFRVLYLDSIESQPQKKDVERIETEYLKLEAKDHILFFDALVYMNLKKYSRCMTIAETEKILQRLENVKMIPQVQLALVLLGELYYLENRFDDAALRIKEAIRLYDDHGISAAFFLGPLQSVELYKGISPILYHAMLNVGIADDKKTHTKLLSSREQEILTLIASGKSNIEIGELLYIGLGTVKWHINNIFSKLEVKNRFQAVEKAKSIGEIN